MTPKIESSWLKVLDEEFQKEYFKKIKSSLVADIEAGKTIYPPMPLLFNAFNTTPFDRVKVVILGQDPYHGSGQAHGLSFSVQEGVSLPPSLKNIFKELKDDIPHLTSPKIGEEINLSQFLPNQVEDKLFVKGGVLNPPQSSFAKGGEIPSGNLTRWAHQGVLLLNASLSVLSGDPMSHSKIGWEIFTDEVIKTLSEKKEGIVFILWGNFARSKKVLIDLNKHFIIESAHPSPLGAYKGFFGSKPFSKTNEILKKLGKEEIEW